MFEARSCDLLRIKLRFSDYIGFLQADGVLPGVRVNLQLVVSHRHWTIILISRSLNPHPLIGMHEGHLVALSQYIVFVYH